MTLFKEGAHRAEYGFTDVEALGKYVLKHPEEFDLEIEHKNADELEDSKKSK